MDIALKTAYAEVNRILDILGEEYKSKLPKEIILLLKESKGTSNIIINNIPVEEIQLSRNALIILSILNLKYWEEDEEKKHKLKSIYAQNEIKFQEKVNLYKEENWLDYNKNEEQKAEEKEEQSLVVMEKTSFIEKVKIFFNRLLHFKWKRDNK